MNVDEKLYQAQVEALTKHLDSVCHKDGPFKEEYQGAFPNCRAWAEYMIRIIRVVEHQLEELDLEKNVASYEGPF